MQLQRLTVFVIAAVAMFEPMTTPAAIGLLRAPVENARVVRAATCGLDDVRRAINSARAGDTVQIPDGRCTWTSQLTMSKAIVLRGAGAGATVIIAGFSSPDDYLIRWGGDGALELAALTIDGGGKTGGLFLFNADGERPVAGVRIHDAAFAHCRQRALTTNGLVYGVAYRNAFTDNFVNVGSLGAEEAGWNAPFSFGDGNTFFVEDNTFTFSSDAAKGQVFYNAQGGRMVVRHNRATGFIDYDIADSHGNIGEWPANRGTVGAEFYRNTFALTPGEHTAWRLYYHRGGQLLAFNNAVTGGSAGIDLSEEDVWQTAFGCPCPIHDTVENSFFWGNTANGAPIVPGFNHQPEDGRTLILNAHYFTPVAGPDAAKPAACKPDTFYGTTDTDTLFKCGDGGTWTTFYKPYAYPHPLREQGGKPPQAGGVAR